MNLRDKSAAAHDGHNYARMLTRWTVIAVTSKEVCFGAYLAPLPYGSTVLVNYKKNVISSSADGGCLKKKKKKMSYMHLFVFAPGWCALRRVPLAHFTVAASLLLARRTTLIM